VGPNLKGIGAKYSPRDLLKHIVQPSLAVDPAYATHVIAISDGRILSGRIAERDERRLVLIDAKDQRTVVPVDQVEQESTAPTSLMPEGLLRDLTAQEAADLLAYLNSLRAAVP
jgi:putative heme-binding domain-containing protein